MQFQRNAWYVAALPGEVDRGLLRRVILDEPVLMFRKEDGAVAAVLDRCSHRFAPLSRGRLEGDVVHCKYHGLGFGADGQCVLNPHADTIPPNLHIRAFPLVEKHGLVWIWMGQPGAADPGKIPDVSYMAAPGAKTVHSYLHAEYRYDILIDNLLDLSHADYLHVGSFSGGPPAGAEMKVAEQGDEVVISRMNFSAKPSPMASSLGDLVDMEMLIHWHPGQVIKFQLTTTPAGVPDGPSLVARFAHIATPESAGRTHYFMSITRHHDIANEELDRQMSSMQLTVISTEDGPMLMAVDEQMGGADLMDLHPAVLPVDAGALRVRRVMKRLLAAEA